MRCCTYPSRGARATSRNRTHGGPAAETTPLGGWCNFIGLPAGAVEVSEQQTPYAACKRNMQPFETPLSREPHQRVPGSSWGEAFHGVRPLIQAWYIFNGEPGSAVHADQEPTTHSHTHTSKHHTRLSTSLRYVSGYHTKLSLPPRRRDLFLPETNPPRGDFEAPV